MARKRKGRLVLTDALDLLEATTSKGYPDDGTGVAGDDDRPPGNIVYGEKYKKDNYFNRLTTLQKIWKVDNGDWTWDEFEHSMGMEDFDNYSNTLQGMEDLFPDEVWARVWSKMKNVPDRITTLRFKQAGQPWRKGGEDQTGSDKEHHADIEADGGSIKGADVNKKGIKESNNLTDRIDNIIL